MNRWSFACALAMVSAFGLPGCALEGLMPDGTPGPENAGVNDDALSIGGGGATPSPVALPQGTLVGVTEANTLVYRGIPYAAPPVGALRWQPPQPPIPWVGTRVADTFGSACPQDPESIAKQSEDCLTLNVWVPKTRTKAAPVMVFIHGGAFDNGSGAGYDALPLYTSAELAALGGAVVVTLNYRLGALGFLVSSGLRGESAKGLAGNLGILDQMAALKWVKANIASLGGDPGNVTIFGESAGGMSVCTLMVQAKERGLFHKAIVESGGCPSRPIADQEALGDAYAQSIGCPKGPGQAACLRGKSAAELVATQPTFSIEGYKSKLAGPLPFQPVIDGDLLTGDSTSALASGKAEDVPVIIGNNGNEIPAALYLESAKSPTAFKNLMVATGIPASATSRVMTSYNAARFGSWPLAAGELATDLQFTCPRLRVQNALRRGSSRALHAYHFDRALPIIGTLPIVGAFHGTELMYVFQKAGAFGPVDGYVQTVMGQMWTSFARTGVPRADFAPTWPRASVAGARLDILDSGFVSVGADDREDECRVLDELLVIK